jgi:hypothetical protein
MTRASLMVALLLTTLPGLALAQAPAEPAAVWRCGADGRSFSDLPCAGGRLVDVPAPRSAAEVAAAQAQAEQDRRFAERLVRERQQRERVAPGSGLMGIKHARPVQISAAPALTKKARHQRSAHKHRQRAAALAA